MGEGFPEKVSILYKIYLFNFILKILNPWKKY